MSQATQPAPLDILAALRIAGTSWWREFAPIAGLGAGLVLVPELASRLLHPTIERGGTIMVTVQTACLALFVSAVAYGVLHGLARKPLAPGPFIARGLSAARPGLMVALLLGAGLVSVLIAFTLGGYLGPVGAAAVRTTAAFAGLWGLVTLLPAVPAAVAERLDPVPALVRAAALTRGNRLRVLGLVGLVLLALVPVSGVLSLVMFGGRAPPEQVERLMNALGPADLGLWIELLVDLLVTGLLACVPTSVYALLVTGQRADAARA